MVRKFACVAAALLLVRPPALALVLLVVGGTPFIELNRSLETVMIKSLK
jgi:hypothetical protein